MHLSEHPKMCSVSLTKICMGFSSVPKATVLYLNNLRTCTINWKTWFCAVFCFVFFLDEGDSVSCSSKRKGGARERSGQRWEKQKKNPGKDAKRKRHSKFKCHIL